MWLFALFVAVPIIEIALFIQVGGLIGLWPTLAIVLLTAFAGTALMRAEGRGAMAALQRSVAQGDDPSGPIAHGAMILVAGVLLLTPGFFTDAMGLALLLPPVRAALIAWGAARLAAGLRSGRVVVATSGGFGAGPSHRPGPAAGPGAGAGDVIEGDYEPADGDPRSGASGAESSRSDPSSPWRS
ncbi:MAG: FxsA family protein [Pseudomonadota bacterium]|nr:FxsA family protein [Pseudomonadota bacterium]MEE3100184.1 FxsA family protein [Pseudomonadota bacterium]